MGLRRLGMGMMCVALVAGCGEDATSGAEGTESTTSLEGGETPGIEGESFPEVSLDGTIGEDTEGTDEEDTVSSPEEDTAVVPDAQLDAEEGPEESDVEGPVDEDVTEEGDSTWAEDIVEGDTAEEEDVVIIVDGCPTQPNFQMPSQSGVVYVAHYHTDEVRWYRTDGPYPYQEGVISTAGLAHASALDPVRDLLAVAHDVQKNVELFALTRPASPEDAVPAPELVATIELEEYAPRTMVFDAARGRLYIASNAPVEEGLLESMWLHVYDVNGDTPYKVIQPVEIPVTVTMDIDPYAGLLGLVGLNSNTLNLYNIQGKDVVPLPGNAINLKSLYPQTNSTGFQVRGLKFDPHNGRVLAARAQSNLSEVIAFSYPTVVGSEEECPGLFTMFDLEMIPDGFDVDKNPSEWNNLLGAFAVLPMATSDAVMFIANAWNGSLASAAVFPLDGSLSPQEGCGDYAGTGCFYRGFFEGNPITYSQTDGASCLDETHKVVVGTSYEPSAETQSGGLHFFQFDATLSMTKWIAKDGGGVQASGLPIGAECH